jgi:hypothetical protein
LQQSIIHVYHDDLLLDEEEEDTQVQNNNVRSEDDDAMEVDDGGGSNSNQTTSRRSNTISYEDFTKIRDKIISKLVEKKCELFYLIFFIPTLYNTVFI